MSIMERCTQTRQTGYQCAFSLSREIVFMHVARPLILFVFYVQPIYTPEECEVKKNSMKSSALKCQ